MFAFIRERLLASTLTDRLVESSGHVWVALEVPLEIGGEDLVGALVSQIEDVVRVAYDPVSPTRIPDNPRS